jgi:hypothetical protein
MPLVYFSGGIDSTTLAWDLATRPHRYGIADRNSRLVLLTSTGGKLATKAKQLDSLVTDIHRASVGGVDLQVIHNPLQGDEPEDTYQGGMQTIHPENAGEYGPDYDAFPYSPGLTMWLVAMGCNVMSQMSRPPFGKQKAFFGFMLDGVLWNQYDKGGHRTTDTSVDYVRAINKAISISDNTMEVRAPFLDHRMDKSMIVKLAQEIGVPLTKTSSCIRGWKVDCGICGQCIRRATVFKALEVTK